MNTPDCYKCSSHLQLQSAHYCFFHLHSACHLHLFQCVSAPLHLMQSAFSIGH